MANNGTLHIEIDCAPGSPRPGQYFKQISTFMSKNSNEYISGLGCRLIEMNPDPVSKRFGNWEWDITLTDKEFVVSKDIKKIWEAELTRLYHSGHIRFASWD